MSFAIMDGDNYEVVGWIQFVSLPPLSSQSIPRILVCLRRESVAVFH